MNLFMSFFFFLYIQLFASICCCYCFYCCCYNWPLQRLLSYYHLNCFICCLLFYTFFQFSLYFVYIYFYCYCLLHTPSNSLFFFLKFIDFYRNLTVVYGFYFIKFRTFYIYFCNSHGKLKCRNKNERQKQIFKI